MTKPKKINNSGKPQRGSEVRFELVHQFRDGIADGSYQVRAKEIAEKMVQKIRDGRNPWIH